MSCSSTTSREFTEDTEFVPSVLGISATKRHRAAKPKPKERKCGTQEIRNGKKPTDESGTQELWNGT